MKKTRDVIANEYPDTPLLFMDPCESFDEAIIGVGEGCGNSPKVVYDYDKVIEINMQDGMTYDDAVEFFEYNQLGAYVGEYTPIFVTRYDIGKEENESN